MLEGEEGVREEDISIILTEKKEEDRSFRNRTSDLTNPKEQWHRGLKVL